MLEKVPGAADEMVGCLSLGGALSGEHGIGLEKRDLMPLISPIDLDAQARIKEAFDPGGVFNPARSFRRLAVLRFRRGEAGDSRGGLGMTGTAGGGPERVAPSSVEDLAVILENATEERRV